MTKLEELERRIAELETRFSELGQEAGGLSVPLEKEGIQEFVEGSVDPSHHYERVVAIGYYLEATEGPGFTSEDIKEGYGSCRVQRPARIQNILERAEDEGWIMRDGERKGKILWKITNPGTEFIEGRVENES